MTAHVGVLDRHGREIAARDWLADPGIPIPDGAAAVHGISTEQRRAGRPAAEVVAELYAHCGCCSRRACRSWHTTPLRLLALAHEAVRHGIPALSDPSTGHRPAGDRQGHRPVSSKRTLSVVAEHYAVAGRCPRASADAIAASRVALALAKEFAYRHRGRAAHTGRLGSIRPPT
ncbi:hypothetical protein [Microbacterium sp.]|uniref:hypothetical protein n=1 Tax=Microbacterium sp. TaxID=51671 RepID=UPI003A951919